ncbi:unnamed protein product, partial [Durusdinium trenchii]
SFHATNGKSERAMERRGRWQKRAGESEEKPGDDRHAFSREGSDSEGFWDELPPAPAAATVAPVMPVVRPLEPVMARGPKVTQKQRKLPAGPERHEQTTEVKPVDRLKAADLERWDAEHQSVPRCPDEVTFQLDPGLEEEKNVLEAIYGPEFEALGPSEWRVGFPSPPGSAVRLLLPAGYPTLEPPVPIFDYEGLRHAMAEAICE